MEEWLERSEQEKEDLQKWKLSENCLKFCDLVYGAFLKDEQGPFLTFLKTPYSSGFLIEFKENQFALQDVQRFMDFLQEKVLSLNYKRQLSDYRLYTKNNKVERIERFYLKPRLKILTTNKVVQQFGNVIIELTIRAEVPLNLKFQVNKYSDRYFTDSESFEDLMKQIFE